VRTAVMPAQLHKLDGRIFFFSVLFEVVAIFCCLWLLIKLGRSGYIFAAIAVIVGLHFIGMWKASGRKDCLWLAAILCMSGIAATLLPFPVRNQILGLGVSAALWTCAILRIEQGKQPRLNVSS